MSNHKWRFKKLWVFIIVLLCWVLFTTLECNFVQKELKINLNQLTKLTITSPTNAYQNEIKNCYLNREKTKILRNKELKIVKTKNVIQKSQQKNFNFVYLIEFFKRSIKKDWAVTITLSPCNIMQLYYNLKTYAGRLTNDKNVVEFMYNALRITTLAAVHLNGKDENFQISMGEAWRATHPNDYKHIKLSLKIMLDHGINALNTYKQPFLTNEMGFKNDKTLFSHYAILQGLRYSQHLDMHTKKLYPLFRIFNLFQNSQFYALLFKKSLNATKSIIFKYYYLSTTERDDFYSIISK